MKYLVVTIGVLLFFTVSVFGQTYQAEFEEGLQLLNEKQFYQAYQRFNAAYILSNNSGNINFAQKCKSKLDSAAYGIQIQKGRSDSLLKSTNKLTDAFYFYNDNLALAVNNPYSTSTSLYGFINKRGETVIEFKYNYATTFDRKTGYAKVKKDNKNFWLSATGIEYPYNMPIDSLPKIETVKVSNKNESTTINKNLDRFEVQGGEIYHQELNEGIVLYNQEKYYDAYLRFNAVTILARNTDLYKTALQLKDTTVYEIQQLFLKANEALDISNRIISSFYFYEDKFAIAYKDNKFGFINKKGEAVIDYKYDEALPFNSETGFAKVKRNDKYFFIDTLRNEYLLAENLTDIDENTEALDLNNKKLQLLPDNLFKYKNLKILILEDNNLKSIPADIGNLSKLKYLSIKNNNSLSNLPSTIGDLVDLEFLDLSFGALEILPKDMSNLRKLINLNLEWNNLRSIPSFIGDFQNLIILDLSGNRFKYLPPEIGKLTNLKILKIEGSKMHNVMGADIGLADPWMYKHYYKADLEELPKEIGNLQSLEVLSLSENRIDSLPSSIGKLKNLKYLDISDNFINYLPQTIGNLTNLRIFNINHNHFKAFPSEIQNLNISSLDLSNSNLDSLPTGIEYLINIKELNLSNNDLQSLPEEIGGLKELEVLYLSDNEFTELPKSIGNLKKLEILIVYDNKLKELPKEIVKLKNLKEIVLSDNSFSSFPSVLGDLNNLERIDLSKNQLFTFNLKSDKLPSLKILNLSDNNLSTLPKGMGDFTKLERLYLNDNSFTEFPYEFGNLTNLVNLDLSDNELKTLPKSIGNLIKLNDLNADNNKIAMLPSEMKFLLNLEVISLRNNLLSEFPNFGEKCVLNEIDLYGNNITEIPSSVSLLTKLEKLNLKSNSIKMLPESLGHIRTLSKLGLSGNDSLSLSSVCIAFSKYPFDIEMTTYDTNVDSEDALKIVIPKQSSLPPEIGLLSNLTYLMLEDNSVSSIPPEIKHLKKITYINLRNNQITIIPPEIGELKELWLLNLTYNNIEKLPIELNKLEKLENLKLYGNDAITLSTIINTFSNYPKKIEITTVGDINRDSLVLDISISKQKYIPSTIGQLTNLVELDLRGSNISEIPTEITKLKNLKVLSLGAISNKSIIQVRKIENEIPNCTINYATHSDLLENLFYNRAYHDIANFYFENLENYQNLSYKDREIYSKSFNYLGVQHSQRELPKQAKIYYNKSVEIEPTFSAAWFNLGKTYNSLRQIDSAIICLRHASKLEPRNSDIWEGLAYCYYGNDFPNAALCFKEAAMLKSSESNYWNMSGVSYLKAKNYAEAIKMFEKATNAEPENGLLWSNLAHSYNLYENYSMAIPFFEKAIAASDNTYNWHSYANRAYSFINLEDYKNAEMDLKKAMSIKPDYERIFFYWACYYSAQSNKSEAINNIKKAIDLGFDDVDWLEREPLLNSLKEETGFKEQITNLKNK